VNEPTLHEVVRRLDDVAHQITNLVTKIDNDRRRDADTYVNRDVYREYQRLVDATFKSISDDIGDLEKARDTDQAWRRQVALALALSVGSSLVTVAIALISILTR
jgi:hypothetical protein